VTAPVTVLMIEDDPGHATLIERNIRRAGIHNRVRHFLDGGTALAYLFGEGREQGPYLVLLDLNLPDMSGADVLRELKSDEQARRSPVIVLTTTDDQREIQNCYDLGANVYITKPVDYEAFAAAIRQLGLFLSIIQVPKA
jgi:DNA-binding response OmpR family regulator